MEEAGDETMYGPNAPYMKLITMLGLNYFKEEVKWCDQAIAMLKGWSEK